MRKFLINIDIFIKMLFPRRWQKLVMMAWLKSIISPIKRMNTEFDTNREQNLYRLGKGPQVVHIEAVLNDRFDFVDRGIQIVDPETFNPLYIYRESETKPPVYIYTDAELLQAPYIYTDNEINAITVDFVVRVPVAVVFDTDELKALVDRYRLPGKVYTIETY